MNFQLSPKWVVNDTFTFGEPALFNGMMIFGSMSLSEPGYCRAVRLADGRDVWRFPAASSVRGRVFVDAGVAYFSGISTTQPGNVQHSFLYAVDAQTGVQRWRTSADPWLDLLLIDEDHLYFNASKALIPAPINSSDITNLVISVDKATGRVRSSVDIGPGFPRIFRFWNNELVMAREGFQAVQFMDPRTMQPVRTYAAPARIKAAAISGDRCYIAVGPDTAGRYMLTSLRLENLTEEWTQIYPVACDNVFASGDVLAISLFNPDGAADPRYYIHLLDPVNGVARWRYEAGNRVPLIEVVMRGNLLAQTRLRTMPLKPPPPDPDEATFPGPGATLTVALDLRTGREVGKINHPFSTGWVVDSGDGLALANHVQYILALDTLRFWKTSFAGAIRSSPIRTSQGIVFGNANGRLTCLAPENGSERWKENLPAPIEGQTAVANGRIFVGHRAGVTAVGELDGRTIWTSNTPNPVTSAISVYGDAVVFGARDGMIRAISAADGTLEWHFATNGFVEGGVAFDGTKYYSGSADGTLYALDIGGTHVWSFTPMDGTVGEIKSTPLVVGQKVVFGNEGGHLYALDTADGHLLWQIRLRGSLKTSSPLLHTDHFWIGDASGHAYRIALANGNVEWTSPTLGPILGRPAWVMAELYVGTMSGELVVLDIWTGRVIRTTPIGAPVFASPLATQDAIFVADEQGSVHALVPGI